MKRGWKMVSGSAMNSPDLTMMGEIVRYQESSLEVESDALLLFQSAIGQHDEVAWTSIYEFYSPLVRTWAARFLSGIRLDCQEIELLVNGAFAQFARAFSVEKLARSDSLASILCYLKFCTRTVVSNELRRLQACSREVLFDTTDLVECIGVVLDDPAALAIQSIVTQDLWQVIQGELRSEDERLLIYLTCICDMKPSEISRQYGQRFPTPSDIYRMKQSTLERLRRNRRIQGYLAGEQWVAGEQTIALTGLKGYGEPAQPASIGARETNALIKYYQQMAHCGKVGCRKCREGIGHGPYWYSYQVVHGRTITTYIGKELHNSREDESGQQPESRIRYHLQKTSCGKANCSRCQGGTGHGPYWFAYYRVDGKTIRRYVGKTLPDAVTAQDDGSASIERLGDPVYDRES